MAWQISPRFRNNKCMATCTVHLNQREVDYDFRNQSNICIHTFELNYWSILNNIQVFRLQIMRDAFYSYRTLIYAFNQILKKNSWSEHNLVFKKIVQNSYSVRDLQKSHHLEKTFPTEKHLTEKHLMQPLSSQLLKGKSD